MQEPTKRVTFGKQSWQVEVGKKNLKNERGNVKLSNLTTKENNNRKGKGLFIGQPKVAYTSPKNYGDTEHKKSLRAVLTGKHMT